MIYTNLSVSDYFLKIDNLTIFWPLAGVKFKASPERVLNYITGVPRQFVLSDELDGLDGEPSVMIWIIYYVGGFHRITFPVLKSKSDARQIRATRACVSATSSESFFLE